MNPELSIVVIGRNEGHRLVDCLVSISRANLGGLSHEVIYVDSNSTDGSPAQAAALGAQVIAVQPARPCAAVGRNAGWRAARGQLILFLDGDTLLDPDFIPAALAELRANPRHAVVWGHRRERHTQASLYNRVLDLDWVYPPGDSDFCGGDALFTRAALEISGGYDETLIAGEEPELCARLRRLDYRIRHIDVPMTLHDLAMTRFSQYWKRAERAGHAYAEVADRLRDSATPLWSADVRRNLWHGGGLLAAGALAMSLALLQFWWALLTLLLIAGLIILRSAWRARWKSNSPLTLLLYASHSYFQQLPILWGQLRWRFEHKRGIARPLIDYKEGS